MKFLYLKFLSGSGRGRGGGGRLPGALMPKNSGHLRKSESGGEGLRSKGGRIFLLDSTHFGRRGWNV